jgi:hypothetical protein
MRTIEDAARAVDCWHDVHRDCYSLFGENAKKHGKLVVKAFAEACLILHVLRDGVDQDRSSFASVLRADIENPVFMHFLHLSRDDVMYRLTPLMLATSYSWDIDLAECRNRVMAGGDMHYPRPVFQCVGLWWAYRTLGWSGCPYDLDMLLACSPFVVCTPPGLIGIGSAYGFAHWIMYLTDFGRDLTYFKDWRDTNKIGAITNSLCARALCSQHLDLAIELTVASFCLDRLDPALLMGVLAEMRRNLSETGTVAGDSKFGFEPDSLPPGPTHAWQSRYHCLLLAKLLLGLIQRTPAAVDRNWWGGAEARFDRWQEIGIALKFVYEGDTRQGQEILRRGGFDDLVSIADLIGCLDRSSK